MVPDISVTVLAFRACLVEVDPNWNIALRLLLTFAGSNSVCSALAARPNAIIMANIAIPSNRRIGIPPADLKVNSAFAPGAASHPANRAGPPSGTNHALLSDPE